MSTLTCGEHLITIMQMDNMALKLPSHLDLRANSLVNKMN